MYTNMSNILKRLFTSSARVKLLHLFLLNSESEYFVRELTRVLDEQINSIRREVDNLKKIGLLTSRSKNRKKYFKVNSSCVIFEDLKNIFIKTMDSKDALTRKIAKLGDLDLILMSGFFTGKDSSVDLLVVGKIDVNTLETFLDKEIETDKPLRFSIMSKQDFLYRLECKDKFITDLVTNKSNIIGVNKLGKFLNK